VKIFIIGAQGSGKSTQSKLLAEYLNLPFIETGEIFRNLSKDDSGLGKKVKALLQAGELVPDDITSEIVQEKLKNPEYGKGFVMNGYPRNLNQIKLFDPGFDRVFYLDVSDDEVLNRLFKRAREDDTKKLIEKRLSDYHKLTQVVLDYYKQSLKFSHGSNYRNLGILETIDGSGSVEEVQQRLRKALTAK